MFCTLNEPYTKDAYEQQGNKQTVPLYSVNSKPGRIKFRENSDQTSSTIKPTDSQRTDLHHQTPSRVSFCDPLPRYIQPRQRFSLRTTHLTSPKPSAVIRVIPANALGRTDVCPSQKEGEKSTCWCCRFALWTLIGSRHLWCLFITC